MPAETKKHIEAALPKESKHELPKNVTPKEYWITFIPNFKDLTFRMEQTTKVDVNEPSNSIIINSRNLAIESARYTTGDNQPFSPSVTFDEKSERVAFGFDSTLQPGEGRLSFTSKGDFKNEKGEIKGKMSGVYISTWVDENGKKHRWALSDLQPAFARDAFACFDDPGIKTGFNTVIVTPKWTKEHPWGALSNGREIFTYTDDPEVDVHFFERIPKMSTYIEFMLVGEFGMIEGVDNNGVVHKIITTPGKEKQGEYALEMSKKLLEYYADHFGIPYPLKEMKIIAVTEYEAGAMENLGAVTARETNVLVDPKNSSQDAKEHVTVTIAHEHVHMWFGNLVTFKDWRYLWLSESFASYMSNYGIEFVHPEWDFWSHFISKTQNHAMGTDALKSTHPVEVAEVPDPRELGEVFDDISYEKGSSLLHMAKTYIGEQNFRKGVTRYLKEHADGTATSDDFWKAMAEESPEMPVPIDEVMKNWIRKPGYPVITVGEEGGELKLTQSRFFSNPNSRKEANDDTVWQIPLTILEDGQQDPTKHLITDKTGTIPKPKDGNWLMINSGAGSFVRVNYSKEYLDRLRAPIESQTLEPMDRLILIRDAFDLAEAGESSVDKALDLLKSYSKETNLSVWEAIADGLDKVGSLIDEEDKDVKDKFDRFAREIFKPIAEKMGWDKKEEGETNKDVFLRSLALKNLGGYGDEKTIGIAKEKFNSYVEGKSDLDPDIRSAVYSMVASNGGEEEFNALMKLYNDTDSQEEHDRILRNLGGFKQPELINRALKFAIPREGEKGSSKGDSYKLMWSIWENPAGREMAWQFTKDNWDRILELFDDTQFLLPRMIEPIPNFHSKKAEDDVRNFFETHSRPAIKNSIQQALEAVNTRVEWLERDRDVIAKFLNDVK